MASIISAGTTSATALNMSADTTGVLQLSSNNGTVAATVDTSQRVGVGLTTLTERFEVNGAIGASTTSSNNFATGNARAFMDYVPGSNTARFGQLNGASGLTTGKLSLFNNALESVVIDSSGRVTMPYQPMASVYSSSGSGITGSVGTVLAFDQEQVDVGGNYNTSTYRFTAPVTGKYFATLWLLGRNSTSAYCAGLYKNGAQIQGRGAYIEPGSGNEVQGLQTLIISCSAGDYIDARITQTGNGDLYLGDLAGMQFYLIG
jgi:hypothetical protein